MPVFDIELPDKRVLSIEAGDEATALRGAQEWHAHNGGEPPQGQPKQAEMRSYESKAPWRDAIAGALMPDDPKESPIRAKLVEAVMGSRGLGQTGLGAVDLVPPSGAALAFNEAQKAAEGGHWGEAALKSIGALPAPGATLAAKGLQAVAAPGAPKVLTAAEEATGAATRQGIDLPRVALADPHTVTGNAAGRVAGALKEIPVVGSPLAKQARVASDQIGERAGAVSEDFAQGATQAGAGEAAKEGLLDWGKARSGEISKRLYDAVDPLVPETAWRPLTATQKVVADIQAEMRASGSPVNQKALDFVEEALAIPQGLNYKGIKQLRTDIGHLLDGTIMPEAGTSIPALKRIYGGLTEDLKQTVSQFGGPKAVSAWNKADRVGKEIATRREAIEKIVGADAAVSSERVLDRLISFAGSKSTADITKLVTARKTMGADAWNEVASQAVQRLGRNQGNEFSPAIFSKNYGALSENGRNLLFSSTGKDNLKLALDDIATVSQRFKALEKLGNPSGTGRVASLLHVGGLGGLGYGLHAGSIEPMTALGTAIGGHLLARAMAKPVTANSISKMMKAALALAKQPVPSNQALLNASITRLAASIAEIGGDEPELVRARIEQEFKGG